MGMITSLYLRWPFTVVYSIIGPSTLMDLGKASYTESSHGGWPPPSTVESLIDATELKYWRQDFHTLTSLPHMDKWTCMHMSLSTVWETEYS